MKYHQKYGRPDNSTTYCSDTVMRYNQNPIERWTKGCILRFPKKDDLGLAKNYRGITLTSIAAKIYNTLQLYLIEPKIGKKQNSFQWNRSTTSQILTIRRILEGVRAKNQEATVLFVEFSKAFDSIHRGKMEQILLLPKETVVAIMMLYRKKHESKSSFPGWRHKHLRHRSRCTAKRHIIHIPLHHLSRLCA